MHEEGHCGHKLLQIAHLLGGGQRERERDRETERDGDGDEDRQREREQFVRARELGW